MPKKGSSKKTKKTRKVKREPRTKKAGKAVTVPRKLDIDSVEDDTMRRVGRTLRTLEDFLAKWDAAASKPDDLLPQVMKIRKFHDALETWQRDAVRMKGRGDDEARMRRLRDFVLICQTYS